MAVNTPVGPFFCEGGGSWSWAQPRREVSGRDVQVREAHQGRFTGMLRRCSSTAHHGAAGERRCAPNGHALPRPVLPSRAARLALPRGPCCPPARSVLPSRAARVALPRGRCCPPVRPVLPSCAAGVALPRGRCCPPARPVLPCRGPCCPPARPVLPCRGPCTRVALHPKIGSALCAPAE